ncbi:uncharacterized protein [Apostichopus japonicus]|uniref:uncharacterized protein n=1 Tax=Stichopus japonicus TaxID=307972 RepID=UPI003AB1C5CE
MALQQMLPIISLALVCFIYPSNGNALTNRVFQNNGPLSLQVDQGGSYHISIDGTPWLDSHNTFFSINGKMHSTMDGTLKVVSGPTKHSSANSKLGPYEQTDVTWEATNTDKSRITTSFQVYSDISAVVFTQNFSMGGLSNTSVGNANLLCTGFPTFTIAKSMRSELGFLSYGSLFAALQDIGNWKTPVKLIGSGLYSAPLTLFNRTKHTMIISPFKEFMASSLVFDNANDIIMEGIMGNVTEIPKDFIQQTILYYGQGPGIKTSMFEWGQTLLKQYNTKRYKERDVTLNYIGYWTDGGAFYYYNTEPNKTYEQTMIDVKAEADRLFVPYKYYQLDSWWYFKGIGGGVKNWTAMPSVFPDGSGYLFKKLGYPLAAHNRYWSSDTDYASKNGGKWNFIVEKDKAIPQDAEFWDFLLRSSKEEWGLTLYEQDWLNDEFEDMKCTLENVTVARKWLLDMGNAALRNNLTIQYCMPMVRHLLQSVEIPRMNQARASGDYHPGNDQWNIGISSILYHALDIRPFKDNFRTTSANEHHPKYVSEPVPFLQTVISIYSTAPVAPSDSIGFTNVTLLNRTMASDGLLLQPSRPMMAVDGYILNFAFPEENIGIVGLVWSTYSNISGTIYGSILAIDTYSPQDVFPLDVDLPNHESLAYLDGHPENTVWFTEDKPITLSPSSSSNFQLWQTAPTFSFNGQQTWAILGEVKKLVPFSPKRFQKLEVAEVAVTLQLHAGPREKIDINIITLGTMWIATCNSEEAGTMELRITDVNKYTCKKTN